MKVKSPPITPPNEDVPEDEANLPWAAYISSEEPVVPRENDILKGRTMRMHPGNIRFRNQVAALYRQYCRCSKRQEKADLFQTILDAQRESRFLKSTTVNGEILWVKLSSEEAREKVAVTFRSVTKKMKRLGWN